MRHPITGSFSRFDPSLSYKSLCSQIKDAFELDASCGLRFTYEDDEGDRCSVTTEPECTVLPGAGGGDSKRKKGNSAPAAPPQEEHAQGTGGTGLGLVAELEE